MLLQPNSQETYALALLLENANEQGEDSDASVVANSTIERYIDSILNGLAVDNLITPKPISTIDLLSNTQLWSLIYLGTKKMIEDEKGRLNFIFASVIETCKELYPDIELQKDNYTAVDLTNMIIQTELDTSFAFAGLEFVLKVQASLHEQHLNKEGK